MQIKCAHGFFIFKEDRAGEVADFMGLWSLDLVPYEDNFTFKELEDAPEYSIKGGAYLGAICTKTFAGKPWEVFEANGFIFDFGSGLIKQKSEITIPVELQVSGIYYVSNGLILPGSMLSGQKIISYTAHYSFDKSRFRYSEVTFD